MQHDQRALSQAGVRGRRDRYEARMEAYAMLLLTRPGILNDTAARELGVGISTLQRYRAEMRARGWLQPG